jgi:sugar phosphate isomerase/epimerase
MMKTIALSFSILCTASTLNAEPLKVAVELFSFGRDTFEEALQKVDQAGVKHVGFFCGQWVSKEIRERTSPKMSPDAFAKVKSLLVQHEIKVVSFGVCIQRPEAEVIANCRMAAELGAEWISVQVPREVIALYAKHAVRHGLKVAVHNHGPESALPYYKAERLLEAMEGIDPVWACPDVGHYARAGVDVLHNLKVLKGRMGLTHLKDMERFGDPKASVVRFGDGVLDIDGILRAFSEYGLEGYVLIELEGKARQNGVENLKHNVSVIEAFNKTLPASK